MFVVSRPTSSFSSELAYFRSSRGLQVIRIIVGERHDTCSSHLPLKTFI
jgi:hypothetical protein